MQTPRTIRAGASYVRGRIEEDRSPAADIPPPTATINPNDILETTYPLPVQPASAARAAEIQLFGSQPSVAVENAGGGSSSSGGSGSGSSSGSGSGGSGGRFGGGAFTLALLLPLAGAALRRRRRLH